MTRSTGNFRPDLNGLRAIAVLSVILFHFDIPPFTGGFVGVDVFFVLSGFLMTQIVLAGMQEQRFSFVDFYLRRLARILPALLVLACVLLACGYWLLLPPDYLRLGEEVMATSAFFINFRYAASIGYFAADPVNSWLLHCWSLAVEFQFYIVYPAVLWSAWRIGSRRAVGALLLVLTLVSAAFSFWQTGQDQMAAFYLLPARAWEFTAGGLVLFLTAPAQRLRPFAALLGIATILAADLLFKGSLRYPSLWSTVPVTGAVLVIWAGARIRLLEHRLFQFLGTISYSLYLWHWPVVVIGLYTRLGSGLLQVALQLAAAVLLACASYRFVETPLRHAFRAHDWRSSGQVALLALLVLVPTALLLGNDGLPSRVSERLQDVLSESAHTDQYRDGRCFLGPEQPFTALAPECLNPPGGAGKPVLALWGDSLAAHLYPGISAQPWADRYRVVQITASACGATQNGQTADRPLCPEIQRQAQAMILRLKPAVLVLAANDGIPVGELGRLLQTLVTAGLPKILVIGPYPRWKPSPAQIVFGENRWSPERLQDRSTPFNSAVLRQHDRDFRATSEAAGAHYLSVADQACGSDGRCLTLVPQEFGPRLFQMDEMHLTASGSAWISMHLIGPALGHFEKMQRPVVPWGQPLAFDSASPATRYLLRGWMTPEGWGTWTASQAVPGVVQLPVEQGRAPSAIRLEFWGQLGPTLERERFSIRLTGSDDHNYTVDTAQPTRVERLELTAAEKAQIAADGVVRLEFRAQEGKSSKAMGLNQDDRVLGLGIKTITLLP